jgi:uncharacterized protein (TIGR02145 family)
MNSFLKNKKIFTFKNIYAFTLVEIMVVVLIIVIIASLAMVSYTSIRVKSRDVRRISNINTLQTALNAYYKDHGVFPTSITPGQPLRNSSNSITYLDEVPSNPQPRTDHNCPDSEFVYKASSDQQSYSLSGCVGADGDPNKGKLIYSTKEGIFHCGDKITDRDGFEYKTVSIGNQCWMAENLRTRTRPDGSCINEYSNSTNPPCLSISAGTTYGGYSNSMRDCIALNANTRGTENDCQTIGAIYDWRGAMNFKEAQDCNNKYCATPLIEPYQGICPGGWHIPTDIEFTTLERTVCTSSTCNTDFFYTPQPISPPAYLTTDFIPVSRGTNEALKLGPFQTTTLLNGFTYGRRNNVCVIPPCSDIFEQRLSGPGYLMVANESGNASGANTYVRRFTNTSDYKISRDSGRKARSIFVRCIKD